MIFISYTSTYRKYQRKMKKHQVMNDYCQQIPPCLYIPTLINFPKNFTSAICIPS